MHAPVKCSGTSLVLPGIGSRSVASATSWGAPELPLLLLPPVDRLTPHGVPLLVDGLDQACQLLCVQVEGERLGVD